jgi:hypothetical protein
MMLFIPNDACLGSNYSPTLRRRTALANKRRIPATLKPMSKDPRLCQVSVHRHRGGVLNVEVEARTLHEAAGLAIAEFRKLGIDNPGLMQVTVAKPVTYVVQPEKFWKWLNHEAQHVSPQERDIRDKLRDVLGVPLSREEKRQRRER